MTARIARPSTAPMCGRNPNGMVTAMMITECTIVGTISLSARPTISVGRRNGDTSIRSCEPVCISNSRLPPADPAQRPSVTSRYLLLVTAADWRGRVPAGPVRQLACPVLRARERQRAAWLDGH